MTIGNDLKKQIIGENRRHDTDSGSAEVQMAVLTAQIKELTEHMKRHPKDYHSRHGLLAKVNRRNKLSTYLRRTDPKKHVEVLAKLGLRR
ncbi:MAG: small subunit ribosomal protein S15 [Hyphomicrobiaceae bacterium]|jgi:small subunit ribosomal protein S15|nr:30S ribosomal protein S15 [Sphingomonas bacterium]